jgi:sterol desaturase/sphingolipid hydroxylase (fatty acid hydroxylase superfamily)
MLQLATPMTLAYFANLVGPDLFLCLLGPLCLAFWIWMLIDAINNEPQTGNDRIIWVLVIALAQILGALIYYVFRRPERIRKFGR